jgi:hypothetical protein
MGWWPICNGENRGGLDPRRWPAAVAGSSEQRRDEVGPWVREMAGDVGDWFEEAEERGLTRNDVSTVAAPCRRGLIDGGSVPWSARLTPRPENIVEPGACSGRRRRGRRRTRAARPRWSARWGRRRRPLGRRGSTVMARTHVEEVGRVVGEMRGTDAELVEVKARAKPRRAVAYGRWRRQSVLRAD